MKRISTTLAAAALTLAVLLPDHSAAVAQTASDAGATNSASSAAAALSTATRSTTAATGAYGAPTALGATAAKPRLKAPKSVSVRYTKKGFRLKWSKVKGAKKYWVFVVPGDFRSLAPYKPYVTKKLILTIPYAKAPSAKKGLTFSVEAMGGKATTRRLLTVDQMNLANGPFVKIGSKHWKKKAKSKVKTCLKFGGATVVATGVSGGVVMGAAAFIPAVGEVTTAGVITFAAADGIGGFVGCLLFS